MTESMMSADAGEDFDWREYLFGDQGRQLQLLQRLARKRFWDASLAESAYTDSLLKLLEDGGRRLRAYQGRSSPGTYLMAVFRNLLEDYAVGLYGKCRPPEWVKRLGAIWIDLFRRLCCEHRTIEALVNSGHWPEMTRDELMATCRLIKGRVVHCGAKLEFQDLDGAISAGHEPADGLGIDAAMEEWETQQAHGFLSELLGCQETTDTTLSAVRRLGSLDPEDVVLLRMVYGDRLSLAKAARLLGQPEHAVRRRHDLLLAVLRQALDSGISPSSRQRDGANPRANPASSVRPGWNGRDSSAD